MCLGVGDGVECRELGVDGLALIAKELGCDCVSKMMVDCRLIER